MNTYDRMKNQLKMNSHLAGDHQIPDASSNDHSLSSGDDDLQHRGGDKP